jgi:hypothetical protein
MPPSGSASPLSKSPLPLAILVLITLAVVGWFLWNISVDTGLPSIIGIAPAPSVEFAFHDGSTVEYRLTGSVAKPVTPAYSRADEPVLTAAFTAHLTVLGVVDGPHGYIAYTSVDPAAAAAAAKAGKPVLKDAKNYPAWPYALHLIDATRTPVASVFMAAGYAPAFSKNNTLVALAPEGVSSYDLQTGTRKLLIPAADVNTAAFALATDASYAVVPNAATHALDVFSLDMGAKAASFLGSVEVAAKAVSFTGADQFVVKTTDTSADLYRVTPTGATRERTILLAPHS